MNYPVFNASKKQTHFSVWYTKTRAARSTRGCRLKEADAFQRLVSARERTRRESA